MAVALSFAELSTRNAVGEFAQGGGAGSIGPRKRFRKTIILLKRASIALCQRHGSHSCGPLPILVVL